MLDGAWLCVMRGMARHVLITGCSSGFGRLTSETLAARGHRVFAGMRDVQGRNAAVAAALRGFRPDSGGTIEPVEMDIGSDASVEAAVASVIAACGSIDVVVNNAAIASFGLLEGFTSEQLAQIFNVNVGGLHRVNRAVLPAMRARGDGLLVHIGSTVGRVVLPVMALYCATKFAIEALVEGYHYELAPLGVEAILVQPGAYKTGMMVGPLTPADVRENYGVSAELARQLGAGIEASLRGPGGPDPQAVADEVLRLIEMPAGTRPLRTVTDSNPHPANEINGLCAQVQVGVLGAMGMGQLLTVATRTAAS